MAQDEFTKLFKYMTSRFDSIDSKLQKQATKEDTKKIMSALDSVVKNQEISDDERLVMGYQLDRLNRWTQELATKIGYKLTTQINVDQ